MRIIDPATDWIIRPADQRGPQPGAPPRKGKMPAQAGCFLTPDMLILSTYELAGDLEATMPILQAFGPSKAHISMPPPAVGLSAAARRYGVLPVPSLEWNEQVAKETAPLYARVEKVIPSVEW